jgi:hypothetical protein
MPRALTPRQTRLLRMRSQHLAPAAALSTVAEVAGAAGGLQAQSWPAAVLGVRPRSIGLTAEDVDGARVDERSVVRSWFMRGTLHLLPAEDVGWVLGLLGPIQVASAAKRRADLGLDDATYAQGVRALEGLLADGPLTRAEIERGLLARRVPIRPKTQALIHLIQRAALEGRVCYGPQVGREQAFVLLRDWVEVGRPTSPDVAAVELARRYIAAFAPAGLADFAKWSGLPTPRARQALGALGKELVEVEAFGAPALISRKALTDLGELEHAEPVVRMTGAFDTYLIGYRERGAVVEEERLYGHVWYGGLIAPVVLVDGVFAATWKAERKARETVVRVAPCGLDESLRPALEAEVADLGRFLGTPARLVVETPER